MQQQISLITLSVTDLARSKRFYGAGFGWRPVFENEEIVFYQMNGLILGTYLEASFLKDANRESFARPGGFSLAHNVRSRDEVEPVMNGLIAAGGKLLRAADEPVHGGFRGYVTDPDDHAWEIAFQPGIAFGEDGQVRFAL